MPISIRAYLNALLSSNSISKERADCIYQEYLRLKENYLAGKLDKSAIDEMASIRTELGRNRMRESDLLPNVEDTVLFTIAESICEKAKRTR